MPTFTDIDGVFGSGIHSGIKASGDKDLAYIYIPNTYATAGVFTRNQYPASSVVYTRSILKKGPIKAMIITSGNANAGTGQSGTQHTKEIARAAAHHLGLKPSEVGVASTGKIGCALPIDAIQAGLTHLFSEKPKQDGHLVAQSILTTDTFPKEVFLEDTIDGCHMIVAGTTKGSGMIAPNMATTLSFLVTNVAIAQTPLQSRLQDAVNRSFNMMSVDTDTSTNDMLLLFSAGKPKNALVTKAQWAGFETLLTNACIALAKLIAKDGEGATKLIEVNVTHAASVTDARKIAKNVVNSPLVKTAIHGADPNWGRIIAAACKDPSVKINPNKITLHIGPHLIFQNGEPIPFDPLIVSETLTQDNIVIALNLGLATSSATAWGCDLTHGYIDINTKYC